MPINAELQMAPASF